MPFKSKKQQRFMYAAKPKGVDLKEWAKNTNFDKLPEKVKKKKKKTDKSDLEGPGHKALEMARIYEMLARRLNEESAD